MRKWYIRGTHHQQHEHDNLGMSHMSHMSHNLPPIYSHFDDDGNQVQPSKFAVTPSRNQTKPYVWQLFTQKGRTKMPDLTQILGTALQENCVKNG